MNLGRLWRTVRPLRREQLLERLVHEARQVAFRQVPALLRWRLEGRGPPPAVALQLPAPVADPEARARAEASHDSGRVRLAGHDVAPTDWDSAALPKLVRYHLQYLEVARSWVDATAQGAAAALGEDGVALVRRWSDAHPVAGSEAWEPYPVSARLQNLSIIAGRLGPSAPDWLRALLTSHARYVAAFPERHLQGNHLLKSWTALACAGLVLSGADAERWRARALLELQRELADQILADGGHCERSPMYHLLLLVDLLDVRDLAASRLLPLPGLEPTLERMAAFLAATLHPDGDIPLFNDSVLGQAPSPAAAFARLGHVPPATSGRIFDARESGLLVLRPGRDEALIFDAGALGPAHQPGHAHSDTLSYELSLAGERRVVNAGVDGYQSPHRAFFRSAVAHNTVTVNGDGPDELWGSFRVGGRSQVVARGASDSVGFLAVTGALEAFQGWRQQRTMLFFPRRALVVLDQVTLRRGEGWVVSRARLVPGAAPVRFVPLTGEPQERTTAYAPEFGKVFEAQEHSVQARGREVRLGYALVWDGSDVALGEGPQGLEVLVGGQRYRPW